MLKSSFLANKPTYITNYDVIPGNMVVSPDMTVFAYKIKYTINYDVIPGNMVVPPDMTVLAYKSFLMSTSHFMIELYVVSCTPTLSLPMKLGWNKTSGHLNRSLPMVITLRTLKNMFFSNCCFVL